MFSRINHAVFWTKIFQKDKKILNNFSSLSKGFKPSKNTKFIVLGKMATSCIEHKRKAASFDCLLKTLKYQHGSKFWISPKQKFSLQTLHK